MKLLVFEYSSINLTDNLISEGFNMLKGILNDLDNNSFFDVYYLINKKIDNICNSCTAIHVNSDLYDWLNKNAQHFDYCLFIAPEDNFIQYNITKILEKNNVYILGCDSNSSYICTSKNLTYKKISSNILKVKTIKSNVNELTYKIIKNNFNNKSCIIKPDDKTSSDFVYLINDKKEFNKIINIYKDSSIKEVLIQEYIEGTPVSVSIICNEEYVKCISLNSQNMKISKNKLMYLGCESPIKHHLEKEIFKLSEKIVKEINGLKGFIGIDYVIKNDKIYFIEINSRITTPYIILQKVIKENLTMTMINFIINKRKIKLSFKTKGTFKK